MKWLSLVSEEKLFDDFEDDVSVCSEMNSMNKSQSVNVEGNKSKIGKKRNSVDNSWQK